jgi:hypothetical protein
MLPYSTSTFLALAVSNASENDITIIVEPSSGILRAVWARQLLTGSLMDSYHYLLDEAVKADCRFWHLDLRLRIWPAATFRIWLTETFAPLATQRLGGPIFVAYWVAAHQQPTANTMLEGEMREQMAKVGFYPAFFEKELDARAWLLQQQQAAAGL